MMKAPEHDWTRLDAMSETESHAAALADPDARPLTEADTARMRNVPRVKTLHRALGLTQEEFAARYQIPLGTLREPSLRRSVTIDGVAYWDGGYSANPPLFSLLRARRSDDVLIVMLSPWSFGGEPKGAEQIRTRALEIAFNAAFLCEARLIAQATRLAQQALWPGPLERALRAMRWHLIDGHDTLSALPTDSKLITHPQLLTRLHDAGRERALDWLARGGKAVGARSSVDLRSLFGGGVPRGMGGDALAEVASGR